jgi:hypothetical protein
LRNLSASSIWAQLMEGSSVLGNLSKIYWLLIGGIRKDIVPVLLGRTSIRRKRVTGYEYQTSHQTAFQFFLISHTVEHTLVATVALA